MAQELKHPIHSGFWKRVNNLEDRSFSAKLIRFSRSRIMALTDTLYALADEPRTFQALLKGWDKDHFQRLIRWKDIGFEPETIYDIGANKGEWSRMCRHLFPGANLHLFEPLSRFHESLKRLESGRTTFSGQTKLHPLALGDENGSAEIHVTENVAASSILAPKTETMTSRFGTKSNQTEVIQVRRLDDLAGEEQLPTPTLVKIDVQGFESEVFKGGRNTLAQAKAVIVEVSLAELYQGQPLLMDMIELLESLEFSLDDLVESCRSWPDGRLWQVDLWMTKRDEHTSL